MTATYRDLKQKSLRQFFCLRFPATCWISFIYIIRQNEYFMEISIINLKELKLDTGR